MNAAFVGIFNAAQQAGSERAVARVPQLASRVCAWQEVGRLAGSEVAATVSAFHPLWAGVAGGEVAWIDQSCTHGVFRTVAARFLCAGAIA
jgi:hypothetical protein